MARFLEEAGFVNTIHGFQMRRVQAMAAPSVAEDLDNDAEADDGPQISESA
jgi:hypothetical protein